MTQTYLCRSTAEVMALLNMQTKKLATINLRTRKESVEDVSDMLISKIFEDAMTGRNGWRFEIVADDNAAKIYEDCL